MNDHDLLVVDVTDGDWAGLTVSTQASATGLRMNDPPGELHHVISEVPAWPVVADDKRVWKVLDRRRSVRMYVQRGNTHTRCRSSRRYSIPRSGRRSHDRG